MALIIIGVLGGYGRVGFATCKHCLTIPECRVLVGGRDAKKLAASIAELGSLAAGMPVDIFDQAALDAFCEQCDLLINTAGPAAKIGDRIARAALRRGINYIDASGTEALYADLARTLPEIQEKGLTFIIAAGIFPGLSGVFPAYIADSQFDSVDLMEICFASEGDTISFNAAYDVVSSLSDGYAHGMCQYEKGRLTSKGITPKQMELPEPIGTIQAYPSLSQELVTLADNRSVNTARAYLAIMDNALGAMFQIRSGRLFETEEKRIASSKMMMKATELDVVNSRRCTMYHLYVKGMYDGVEKEVTSVLEFYDADDATLTGIVVAETARVLLQEKKPQTGRFFLWESVSPTLLMEALSRHSIIPSLDIEQDEIFETGII